MQGRVIVERKSMRGNRLRVELEYANTRDAFEWQVFYPNELGGLGARLGFREILRCTNFDPLQLPNAEMPRMQFVFEKVV